LSLRASEGSGEAPPQPKQRNTKLIVLAAVTAVVVVVAALGFFGVIHVPFIGSKTETVGDPVYGWTLSIPVKWAAHSQTFNNSTTTIRFQSDGSNVGVRVEAERFSEEMPVDAIQGDTVINQLKMLVTRHGPDTTILEGPTFGSLRGVPYVRYVYTFTDTSGQVPRELKDLQYYVFNGAKLEIVTFETTTKNWSSVLGDMNTALASFHSQHLGVGPSPTGTASPSHSPTSTASPSASPSASGAGAGSPSVAATVTSTASP